MTHHSPVVAGAGQLPVRSVGQQILVLLALAGVILFTCSFGPNLDLAVLSLAVLVGGCLMLWRPGESPILIMTFCLHWLGASVAAFHSNWLGIDIFSYSEFGGEMRQATALSLVALFCVAVGMRLGAGAWRPREADLARRIALAQPVSRWFYLYCIACAVSFTALLLIFTVPALAQILIALAALRWAFFVVLAYASLARGSGQIGPYLPLAFCGELAISIGGFFSDFKSVFLFMICASFASGLRLTLRKQAALAILVSALIGFIVVWTAVKQDYRQFVSEGRNQQVVAVDYATSMGKLVGLVDALDRQTIDASVDKLLHRLSYVEYFSVVLDFVPNEVDHTHGTLLADAVSRPFLPRALFPEKSIIDDSERTNFYTGGLAGANEATSISLGYVAESYIDFGIYGMMGALFGIGCAYGFAYRVLTRSKGAGSLLGMGMASAVLMTIGGLESSFTKVAGGFVALLLVALLFIKFVVPLALPWVAEPRVAR